ncbi:hypothetical protein FRX31_029256 [Thalictrum thalictroides]|uniref:Uncharacterized protein n=1 Tax=Thalictrum thalictroides TaxID=46969 RepID=A0A7J6V8Q1_THATH|nr:hypothetical protein FRX31_029256 [Thalictrum thalictroides]
MGEPSGTAISTEPVPISATQQPQESLPKTGEKKEYANNSEPVSTSDVPQQQEGVQSPTDSPQPDTSKKKKRYYYHSYK